MRSNLTAVGVLAVALGAGAAAASPPAPTARSVQLIVMGAPAQPDTTSVRGTVAAEAPPLLDTAELASQFRVHDLSRRWVEHQMGASFAAGPEAQDASDGDPFAYVGIAQPLVSPVGVSVLPAAFIPVPPWMRGGAVYASAAARYVPGCSLAPYRPTGFLRLDAESRRASYFGIMSNIACEYGIPVGLFDAMIIRESQYQPDVYSPKNAFGLTQLMPATAISLGVNRYSVEGNLRGGARYLREQLDRFGHYHLALAAYNAGPGRVRNGRIPPIAETQAYVDNVLLNWSRLSGVGRQATIVSGETASYAQPGLKTGRRAAVSTF
ncbi:lytic transglycosylase domain-containing protein [Novosphingobium pentaromativorans]|uniref:lytic transglycosylase domain-containing protein n=1 Tax=Novosphingobium pentaromativorans TaxID=205844 RepID=UPI00051F68D7|nr:lytic transglycosylase domain-containing protein [Novosphingobium pentaromativorans]AIT82479.1 lytic transglycosylase [Novosphingobium pentaromativorans US6-1]